MRFEERTSREDFRLLNPAFLGLVVAKAAQGYWKEKQIGMPFVYAFIVPALVLHPDIRSHLPNTVVTRLISWTERNSEQLVRFPKAMAELVQATKEGMLYGSVTGMIETGKSCSIIPKIKDAEIIKFERDCGSIEVEQILKKSLFVGRWLATSGLPTTVLTSLGVELESNSGSDRTL